MRALLPALLVCVACSDAVKVELPQLITPLDSTIDFGSVAVGEVVVRGVPLNVRGGGGLTVDPSTVPAGFSAVIGPGWTVVVTFSPDLDGDYSGTIVVRAGGSLARVHVAAKVYPWLVDPLGTSLAFDPVKVGESADKTVRIRNDLSIPAQVAVFADDPAFSVEPEQLTLNAGTHADVTVSFHPRARGRFESVLHVAPCAICKGKSISLLGYGQSEHFQTSSTSIDFGKQLVGSSTCRPVTVLNDGDLPLYFLSVQLADFQDQTSPFSLTIGPLLRPGASLGPGESENAQVCFAPRELGRPSQTTLLFHRGTGFDTAITVTGTCGGPVLASDPTAIDLGVTPPGTAVGQDLLIEASGDPGPLVLGGVELRGDDPAFHLEYSGGDPVGQDAGAAPVRLRVVMDGTPGAHTTSIVAHALYRQDLVVPVQGAVVDGEPCQLDVPSEVQFGLVHEPQSLVRPVGIHNSGATACPVWGFGIDAAVPDWNTNTFVLTEAPSGMALIPPAGDLTINVTYQTASASTDADRAVLHFRRLPPPGLGTTLTVDLSGFATMLEVSVSPDPIDFGAVALGDSAHLPVAFHNKSPRPVRVGGNQPLPNPAGDIAMSIDSPAAFSVSGLPSQWPQSVPGGGTMNFVLDFSPTMSGHYAGVLEIWLQNVPTPVLVPVVAEGSP